MAHNIDMTNDRANIAYLGSRNDVWHRLGQEMQSGMSIDAWAKAAGLDWSAVKVPAIASLEGATFDHIDAGHRFRVVDERNFVVRSDNGHARGNGVSAAEKQFTSAQFGSGAAMKAKAVDLLMPRIVDKVPVLAA